MPTAARNDPRRHQTQLKTMLEKTITFDRFVRLMLGGLLAISILCILNYLSSVLLPFFIGWLLAYLIYPIVCFIQYRMHVRGRVPSIIIAMILIAGIIGILTYLIIPPMFEQFERLSYLTAQYLHNTTHIGNFQIAIHDWFINNYDSIQQFFRDEEISEAIRNAMPKVFSVIGRTASMALSIVASLITLLYTFFILLDYEVLADGFIKIFPQKNRPFWKSLISDAERELNSYVRGQSLVALCIAILSCIGYTIIGFPMAIGLGIMIGVMSLIPYVHSLALIPIVFLSLLKAADTDSNFWMILLGALTVFGIVQVITDMVLTPKIMGKAMGLNPAVLLLSLSVWGALLGFIGLIIALPLTTLLIAYYQRYITKEHETEEKTEKLAK